MSAREVCLQPDEEKLITPEEVRDPVLRRALQERSISIVRPATEEEDAALQDRLGPEHS